MDTRLIQARYGCSSRNLARTLIRKPKITSEGKVRALSRILAHRSSDWLDSTGGQTKSDEKRGKRERENVAEIRAITSDDNNYAPVFIVTRHATEILLSTVVFSSPSLSLFSRLAAAQASRPCEKKKEKKKKSLTSRGAAPVKSRVANDRESVDGEPDRRKMKLVVPVLVFDYSLLSSRGNVAKNMTAHARLER